jgi:hypothetical protein
VSPDALAVSTTAARARPAQRYLWHPGRGYAAGVTDQARSTVADVDACDDEQLVGWLLEQIDGAPEIEQGENFITERLGEWFPGARGVGAPRIVGPDGAPSLEMTEAARIDARLRGAYDELMARRLIERDPTSGRTFCKLTAEGRRVLAELRAQP